MWRCVRVVVRLQSGARRRNLVKVFLTGGSGWIGSAAVGELIAVGHDVVGLARSDASAAALADKHAAVLRGDLDDLDSLRRGASDADAVVHLANKHDWANPAAMNAAERTAVETIAQTLAGSDRPFVVASGLSGLDEGCPALESDRLATVGPDSPGLPPARPWRRTSSPAPTAHLKRDRKGLSMTVSSRSSGRGRCVEAEFTSVSQQCPQHVDQAPGQG
ncbi:NAD-dependent epimerase/dehydratase family protein [Nocardia sp. CA-084685]|uniref:NAD-dependent epimerase/dehydratase family protein n=1 Tax=Nocardia sp. CA-084685 TaxID=3239970 RepID=UPI003D99FDB4